MEISLEIETWADNNGVMSGILKIVDAQNGKVLAEIDLVQIQDAIKAIFRSRLE